MEWYCFINGQQYGPVSEEELRRWAAEGRLKPSDQVWNQSLGNQWVSASSIPGLIAGVAGAGLHGRLPGTGGQTPNAELMRQARERMTGWWGLGVGVTLVFWLICNAASSVAGIFAFIITGSMTLGFVMLFLTISRRQQARFGQLFDGFKNFGTALGTYVLIGIFVFLWSLLLIVPGIIAAYSYSMAFYLLADNPNLGPLEAIRRSKEMMRGHKGKLFCLQFRFIGWVLLSILTFFIGFLWLMPYMETAKARFYDDLAPAASWLSQPVDSVGPQPVQSGFPPRPGSA